MKLRILIAAVGLLLATGASGKGCGKKEKRVTCDGITCSGNGRCAIAGSQAVCVCDEGYGPVGQECIACGDIAPDDLPAIDVPMVSLSGSFLIGGQPAPQSQYEHGTVTLESDLQGTVELGPTYQQTFSARIMPGTYEVFYEHVNGATVPANTHARVGTLEAYDDVKDFVIDVPFAEIQGDILMNGQAPPQSEYDDGEVVLFVPEIGDEVLLANTHQLDYAVRAVPGSYQARYRSETRGAVAPWNENGRISDVEVPEEGGQIDIDMDVVEISGGMFLPAGPPPQSQYEHGEIRFVTEDDELLVAKTYDQTYTARLLAGSYDVIYHHVDGAQMPVNMRGRVDTAVDFTSSTSYDVMLVPYQAGGVVEINGNPAPQSAYEHGTLYATTAEGDVAELGQTHEGFSVLLLQGDYDVVYNHAEGSTVPTNLLSAVDSLSVTQNDINHVVSINASQLSGGVLLDGNDAPKSQYEYGLSALFSETQGFVPLGPSYDSYSTLVVDGTYDVRFGHVDGAELPQNQNASVGELVVNGGNVSADVELSTTELSTDVTVNGETPPLSQYDHGRLHMSDGGFDVVELGPTYAESVDARILPATYDVLYSLVQGANGVPANVDGRVACFAAP